MRPFLFAFLLGTGLVGLRAQTPAPAPVPGIPAADVSIQGVEIRQEAAPGGGKAWGKILVQFSTRPDWSDGLLISAKALFDKGGERSVLRGEVLYANVAKGSHVGSLYVSPGTIERYGEPVAVQVTALLGEDPAPVVFVTKPKGNVETNWPVKYNVRKGLLPIYQTPWVATESGKYPDFLVR